MFAISTVGLYVNPNSVSSYYQNEVSTWHSTRPLAVVEWFGSRVETKMTDNLRGSAHNRDAGSAVMASFGPNIVPSRQNGHKLNQWIIYILAQIYGDMRWK